MRPCSSTAPLALLLLVTASVARAQPSPCHLALRRLELTPSPAALPELCVSPGLSTTLLFDEELVLETVELEGRERFRRVESTGGLLLLLPSERLAPGERLRLKVRFAEAAPVSSAAFVLVVHREQAERQVEVSAPPASGLCQAELQRKEVELQRCLAQRPSPSNPASLAALIMLEGVDARLLASRSAEPPSLSGASGEAFLVKQVMLHRSRSRFVVELQVLNTHHPAPWMAAGATLLGRSGERLQPFTVLQEHPLGPAEVGRVWVEAPVELVEHWGPLTLEVWDAERTHTFTLKDLRLP